VGVPNKIYRVSGIDLRHMGHENKFDEKSVGFDSASKPGVVLLLQEVFLKKTFRIRLGSKFALDCGLRDIGLT